MRFFNFAKKIMASGILFLFIFSISGTFVYAETKVTCKDGKASDNSSYCSLTTIPGAFDPKTGVNPVNVIKNIYGISIGIGAILAVVMIIWAGVEYATTEAITGKSAAKERWQGALFGLVLLLASYIILRTINIDLVNINLDLGTPVGCRDASGKEIVDANGKSTCTDADVLKKAMQNIENNAKIITEQSKSIEQNIKIVTENTQEKINSLEEQLKNSELTAAEKVNLKKQLDYANTVLLFRNMDDKIVSEVNIQNKNITDGKPVSVTELESILTKEIARLKTLNLPEDDLTTKRALEQRIIDLTNKQKNLTLVKKSILSQFSIYKTVNDRFSSAKPLTPNISVDAFSRELIGKEILVDGQKSTPLSLIQKTVSLVPIQNPEFSSIVSNYGVQVSKLINSVIEKRIVCYDTFKKQGNGALSAIGCSPF